MRPFLLVLGTAQDGGYPQAGCSNPCCSDVREDRSLRRAVSSLAIVDPATSERWIIDATPDFRVQIDLLDRVHPSPKPPGIDGIALTHAHIGHYTGLIHLGPESMDTVEIPVYAMPRMRDFLGRNEPWAQLVRRRKISLRPLSDREPVRLNDRVSITPIQVPHRDEHSETAGFRVEGPNASALYIPDIDGWDRWNIAIADLVSAVSAAYLDGTFYDGDEVPGRDMAEIPHPLIAESIDLFEHLPDPVKSRIRFIHLNHTNPALLPGSEARRRIEGAGLGIAAEGERVSL